MYKWWAKNTFSITTSEENNCAGVQFSLLVIWISDVRKKCFWAFAMMFLNEQLHWYVIHGPNIVLSGLHLQQKNKHCV